MYLEILVQSIIVNNTSKNIFRCIAVSYHLLSLSLPTQ